MFKGLLKAYAKEPEKSLVALGGDVQMFTESSRLRNKRSLYPLPLCLSELLQAYYRKCFDCTACWDSITSQAFDWLCSHA